MSSAAAARALARMGALAILFSAAPVQAETCQVQNTSAPGLWKFVRVYDVDTGQVVLRRAINGGDSVEVRVSGIRARVEFKLAGYTRYKTSANGTCKGGNTLRT